MWTSRPRGGSACARWSTRSRQVHSATLLEFFISASADRCSGRRCWSTRLGVRSSKFNVRFLSNIDGAAFDDAVKTLDPATTLVVVASKTFTTLETLANFEACAGMAAGRRCRGPGRRAHRGDRAPEAAVEAGIDETRILQFGEGVGGRYSLWSSVGVTAALALGWDAFEELLEGAAEMDRHFRFAEPRKRAA